MMAYKLIPIASIISIKNSSQYNGFSIIDKKICQRMRKQKYFKIAVITKKYKI